MVLNSWPMKPSGVQLARPILPPCRQTRTISAAARSWSGVNITPKVDTTTSKLPSANGSASASATAERDVEPFGGGAFARAIEQRVHVVDRHHVAPAPRGRERGIAVAGGDVEHPLPAAEVERFAQLLADDLQRGADDRIVARGPCALLARLDRLEINRCGG